MADLNILHLRASNFYGGPERQLHFHAREAGGTAYHVTIASFTESGATPEFIRVIADDNLPVHVFRVSSAYDTRALSDIRQYLKDNRVDILCTHDYRSVVLAALVVRRMRTRWLAFSRGYTRDNLKVRFYHTLDKFFIRQANHIVAVSEGQKKRLKRLAVRERQITVVPNAIDPDSFSSVVPVDLRTRFDFDPDSLVVIAGGRFSREKGQSVLVRAAVRARANNPRLRFVLFGDGPDLGRIRAEVKREGHEKEIVCPGFEKNLLGCLKGADLLVNPSLSEGLPNIVLEAMALKTPVVATAVGGVPELVRDDVTGFLVPAADPDALAEAVVRAAVTDERERITAAALDHIKREYSFAGQFRKLAALYDRIGS